MKTAKTEKQAPKFSATFTWVNQDGTSNSITVDGPTCDRLYKLILRTPLAVQNEIERKRWTIETVRLDQLADRQRAGCRIFLSVEEANQYITDYTREKETS